MEQRRDSVFVGRESYPSVNPAAISYESGQARDLSAGSSACRIPLPSSPTASEYQDSRHSLDNVLSFNTSEPVDSLPRTSSCPSLPPSQASTGTSIFAAINRLYQPQPPRSEYLQEQNPADSYDRDRRRSYQQLIRELSTHLPHLERVLVHSCYNTTSVRAYDLFEYDTTPIRPFMWYIDLSETSDGGATIDLSAGGATIDAFTKYLKNIPCALKSRVVIVEDLCPQLSLILGSVLDIDPQFFAEHLQDAGHVNGKYDDVPAELWSTHDSKKDYASVRWYRPVTPNATFGETGASCLNFLDQGSWHDRKIATYFEQRRWGKLLHRVEPRTNIFRDRWKLSVELDAEPSSKEPAAWLERASVWRRGSIIVLLLDPVPLVSDARMWGSAALLFEQHMNVFSTLHHAYVPLSPRTILADLNIPSLLSKPMVDDMKKRLEIASSTQEDLFHRLLELPPSDSTTPHWQDLISLLFHIIELDTRKLLRLLHNTLNSVSHALSEEEPSQERLRFWRTQTELFEVRLSELWSSLSNYRKVYDIFLPANDTPQRQKMEVLLDTTTELISTAIARCSRSRASLSSNMQSIESQRAIAEAESVTKLTELAFLFLPLSLAASIFSMQVHELESGTPLSSFIILAVLLAAFAYSARLLIRSSVVLRLRSYCLSAVRDHAGIRPGKPIPTSAFLAWLWSKILWLCTRGLLFATSTLVFTAMVTVPLTLLWRRNINQGYGITITIMFVLSMGFAVYFILRSSAIRSVLLRRNFRSYA